MSWMNSCGRDSFGPDDVPHPHKKPDVPGGSQMIVGQFLAERVVKEEGSCLQWTAVYPVFQQWVKESDHPVDHPLE